MRDGHAVCEGEWAFSEAAFGTDDEVSKAKRSTFGLRCKTRHSEGRKLPYDGSFSGFFMVKQGDGSQVKIREKKVKIQFTKLDGDGDAGANGTTHKVAGQGSNKYGAFVLDGTYDSNSATLSVTKNYTGESGGADSDG